jgi:hypothetical protein
MLLVDRHYNSLRSYRLNRRNVYVVSRGREWQVCYLHARRGRPLLRAETPECFFDCIQPASGESFADQIVGRVAQISMEL